MSDETPPSPPWQSKHRGLGWEDMPGQTRVQQRLTFAQFRRGSWPPPNWRIPSEAEGDALRLLIEERLAMCGRRRGSSPKISGKGGAA